MYVDEKILNQFSKMREVFEDQPIRRLILEDGISGYTISGVLNTNRCVSGGFLDQYCVEKMDIKSYEQAKYNK
jgi:hypothetical protein